MAAAVPKEIKNSARQIGEHKQYGIPAAPFAYHRADQQGSPEKLLTALQANRLNDPRSAAESSRL